MVAIFGMSESGERLRVRRGAGGSETGERPRRLRVARRTAGLKGHRANVAKVAMNTRMSCRDQDRARRAAALEVQTDAGSGAPPRKLNGAPVPFLRLHPGLWKRPRS